MVLPADDVADAEVDVVGAGSKMIGGSAIASEQREILDIFRQLRLLAIDQVVKSTVSPVSRGTRKRTTNFSPVAARWSLSSAGISRCPGLKSQAPPV